MFQQYTYVGRFHFLSSSYAPLTQRGIGIYNKEPKTVIEIGCIYLVYIFGLMSRYMYPALGF